MTYLLLLASYVVSGKAALLLALPPGYASAIFPPAGIAVTAAFIMGRRALPWVLIGAFLLNIWVGYSLTKSIDATGFSAALFIAIASTMQAAIGGWILRRRIGYPAAFDKAREISLFLLWSPIICLVSASLSVGGLAWLGIFDKSSSGSNWASWWAGDTLGVLVMLPIVMALTGEPRPLWKSRIKTVALPMVLVLALFVAMFLKANQWEQYESLTDFRQISQQSLDQIKMGFVEQGALLAQLQGFFEHDIAGKITRQEFHRYCKASLKVFPMIQAMEWVPRITDPDRENFERGERKEMPGFQITERNLAGKMQRDGKRAYYYPVTYVEPMAGNEPALGFDLDSNPMRKQVVAMAVRTGKPIATQPIRLVQEGKGMLIIQHVTIKGDVTGVVLIVLKSQGFINQFLPRSTSDLNIRLLDDDAQVSIYDNFSSHPFKALFLRHFEFGTRHYSLLVTPTAAYYKRHRGWQSWSVLAMGTLGTGLLGALLLLGSGYTARVAEQVRERTDELKLSEERFRHTFERFPIGIGIGSLEGKFLRFNEAFCKILGYRRDEFAHMTITDILPMDKSHDADNKQLLMDDGVGHYRMEKRYARKDGTTVWVQVTVSLEKDAFGCPENFIIQIEDISERKQAEVALSESEGKLRGLYELSPLGIALTDMNGRYIEFNRAFEEICGYPLDELNQLDYWTLTPEEYLNDEARQLESLRTTGHYGPYEKEYIRKDGSLIPIRLNGLLLTGRDGKQYIWSIVEDITLRKELEHKLEIQAHYDLLTMLNNRAYFYELAEKEISRGKRQNNPLGFLMFDVDHFKHVNDTYGHDAGDAVLRELAKCSLKTLREIDIVGRWGGEEFVVLLPGISGSQVKDAAERLRLALSKVKVDIGQDRAISFSVSIGATWRLDSYEKIDDLVKRADKALYAAKYAGRNCVSLDSSMLS